MSNGEVEGMHSNFESMQTTAEDFSPPVEGVDPVDPAGAANSKNAFKGIDTLELILKFELLGPEGGSIIANLIEQENISSERLVAGVLIERGYMTEELMESVVLARYLLACAKITMGQLELVMDEIKDTRAPLWVTLVAKGWLKMSDVV